MSGKAKKGPPGWDMAALLAAIEGTDDSAVAVARYNAATRQAKSRRQLVEILVARGIKHRWKRGVPPKASATDGAVAQRNLREHCRDRYDWRAILTAMGCHHDGSGGWDWNFVACDYAAATGHYRGPAELQEVARVLQLARRVSANPHGDDGDDPEVRLLVDRLREYKQHHQIKSSEMTEEDIDLALGDDPAKWARKERPRAKGDFSCPPRIPKVYTMRLPRGVAG